MEKIDKKIWIYSIPRKSALGLHNAINDSSGKELGMNKIIQGVDTKFTVRYSTKIGGYKTGLYKPWLENGVQKKDKEGNLLTLQDYYEKKHNVPKGTYHNRPTDFRMQRPEKDEERSFMEQLVITLNDGSTVLDLSNPEDELRYEILLEDPICANSEKEWKDHKWDKAEFYIAMENESSEIKYQKTLAKSKALSELHNSNFTLPYKRQAIVILKINTARTVLTEAQVHNLLYEYIDGPSSDMSSNISKFMELADMIKTPKGKIDFEAKYLLQKACDFRVVLEKQGGYTWIRPTGPITIGETYTEAIDFLTNPKKESVISELKSELKIHEE